MKTQHVVQKRVLKALLAAACIASLSIAAQAAPPDHAPAYGSRNNGHRNDRGQGHNNRDRSTYQTFTGQVSNVRGQQFDLRVGGTTYNVYASSRLPSGLDQNDSVRVYGQRSGNNDIRNANVSIIGNNNGNRWDNNGHRWGNNNGNNRWGNYQTFTGTVTDVESNSKFEVRVGGNTYDVYPSGTARRVDEGDIVRIYGRRYGNNDIRNANVVVVRNR